MKIHGLPPTLRETTRYVAFSVICNEGTSVPTMKAIESYVEEAMLHYVGVKGLAGAGAYIVESASTDKQIVIRCSSKYVQDLLMAIEVKAAENYRLKSTKTSGVLSNIKDKPITTRNKRENRKRVL